MRSVLDKSKLTPPNIFYESEGFTFKGAGEWRSTICPFHDDRSPSLRVNFKTGSFKCMACGERGGDIIAFYRKRYGVSFKEACEALGVTLDDIRPVKIESQEDEIKKLKLEIQKLKKIIKNLQANK